MLVVDSWQTKTPLAIRRAGLKNFGFVGLNHFFLLAGCWLLRGAKPRNAAGLRCIINDRSDARGAISCVNSLHERRDDAPVCGSGQAGKRRRNNSGAALLRCRFFIPLTKHSSDYPGFRAGQSGECFVRGMGKGDSWERVENSVKRPQTIQRSRSLTFAGSSVGAWQEFPVQRKTVASFFTDNVLANGSTAPVLPKTILFGE